MKSLVTRYRGEDIYLFTLQNGKGMHVELTNYGAIITSIKFTRRSGEVIDIVLGFDKVEQYLSQSYLDAYSYFGAAIGRYANRIKDARFKIDGKEFRTTVNNKGNTLHGGDSGFDKKTWKLKSYSESSNELTLAHVSADGDEGFPGNLSVELFFKLNENNELHYTYQATTDAPTAVNLTHHSYFNLDGSGDILDHMLRISPPSLLEQDDELCATGKMKPVAHTAWDFQRFRKIGSGMPVGGYDQCFAYDFETRADELLATAYSQRSGLRLEVHSSAPAVQFYTGQGLNISIGKGGRKYAAYSGFCLETHMHPNAVNIPHFPNTILRPSEKYEQRNFYRFTELEEK